MIEFPTHLYGVGDFGVDPDPNNVRHIYVFEDDSKENFSMVNCMIIFSRS